MVAAIPSALSLPNEMGLILYQHPLPERYVAASPVIEISIEQPSESFSDSPHSEKTLCYDRQGRICSLGKKGLFLDTYF